MPSVVRASDISFGLVLLEGERDTVLVVAREGIVNPKVGWWETVEDLEAELQELPFSFAQSMTDLLTSEQGKKLLEASSFGLKGQLIHRSDGIVPVVCGSLPCFVDCIDSIIQSAVLLACCKNDRLLTIRPRLAA